MEAFSHEYFAYNTDVLKEKLALALRRMMEAYDDAPGLREGFGDLPSSLKNGMRFVHHEGIGGPATCEKCGTLYGLASGGCPKCNPPLIRPFAICGKTITDNHGGSSPCAMPTGHVGQCVTEGPLADLANARAQVEHLKKEFDMATGMLRTDLQQAQENNATLTRALDFRNAQHDIERRRANAAVARGQNLVRALKNNLLSAFSWDQMPGAHNEIIRAMKTFEADELAAAAVALANEVNVEVGLECGRIVLVDKERKP